MKKHIPFFLLIPVLLSVSIQGCDKEDQNTINTTSEFTSSVTEVYALPGELFTFEATVSDPAGIKSVNITYEPWFLNKTIVKDSLPTSYDIAYNFKVPQDAQQGSTHTIPITIINGNGNSTSKDFTIILNRNSTVPKIVVNQPIDGTTFLIENGIELYFEITVTDAELAVFKIESTLLNETLSLAGTSYTYTAIVPIENTDSYTFIITVTNAWGNTASQHIDIHVVDELFFEKMYITDEIDQSNLISDLFGIPFSTETSTETDESGYVFTAKYYASIPNAEVRFIPQKTSFEPFTFGANPDIPGTLLTGSDASVPPIVLEDIGYYEIEMDLRNLTYTITPYTPTDNTFNQIYIIGRGISVGETSTCISNTDDAITTCWNFNSGKPFNPDPVNPYQWILEATLEDQPDDEDPNGFILNANANGWAPFWRFDHPSDPENTIPNNGDNYTFEAEDFGDYIFLFDTHLNRISIKKL